MPAKKLFYTVIIMSEKHNCFKYKTNVSEKELAAYEKDYMERPNHHLVAFIGGPAHGVNIKYTSCPECEWNAVNKDNMRQRAEIAEARVKELETALVAAKAEIGMLRGEDCLVDGDDPCGCCTKCQRIRIKELEAALRNLYEASENDAGGG